MSIWDKDYRDRYIPTAEEIVRWGGTGYLIGVPSECHAALVEGMIRTTLNSEIMKTIYANKHWFCPAFGVIRDAYIENGSELPIETVWDNITEYHGTYGDDSGEYIRTTLDKIKKQYGSMV